MDYLEEVKIRLSITKPTYDQLLNSYIKQAMRKVMNYCNRKDIPRELFYVVVAIAVDLYNIGTNENRKVIEEKQGNRSVKYISSCDIDSVVSSYKSELNRFRRVRVI